MNEEVELVEVREDMWRGGNGRRIPHWIGVIRDSEGREANITMFDKAHHTLLTHGYKRMANITRDKPALVILGSGSKRFSYQISDVWSYQSKGWINVEHFNESEKRRVRAGV